MTDAVLSTACSQDVEAESGERARLTDSFCGFPSQCATYIEQAINWRSQIPNLMTNSFPGPRTPYLPGT